jgi:drug/metabolite transporter (DMT)-like permease
LIYTVVELAIPWYLLSSAERRLSSSLSGLLVAAVPLVGTVLSRATGGTDVVDAKGVAGLLIGLGGVAALVGLDVRSADLGTAGGVALVVVGYATGPMILARSLGALLGLGVVAASLGLCAVGLPPSPCSNGQLSSRRDGWSQRSSSSVLCALRSLLSCSST